MAGWTRRHGRNPFPSSIPARVICKGPQNLEKPMATVYDESGGMWGCQLGVVQPEWTGTYGHRQRWEVAAQQGRGVSTTLRALPFACHLAHTAPHAD